MKWWWLSCPMSVSPSTWSGRMAVVSAPGEIDLTNAEGFRDALLSALNAGAAGLVADLTSTTFLDSAGVTALVRASRRATAADATLRLAVTAPPVLRVLNLVGIDRLIEVHPSVSDAAASLPDQSGRGLRLITPRASLQAHQPPATVRRPSSTAAPGRRPAPARRRRSRTDRSSTRRRSASSPRACRRAVRGAGASLGAKQRAAQRCRRRGPRRTRGVPVSQSRTRAVHGPQAVAQAAASLTASTKSASRADPMPVRAPNASSEPADGRDVAPPERPLARASAARPAAAARRSPASLASGYP